MLKKQAFADWLVIVGFVALIALVFQQIYTSMAEQGTASGGPYDNAAAYPRAVAILIGIMLLGQCIVQLMKSNKVSRSEILTIRPLLRPFALLMIFGLYLWLLGVLGYHLTTTPFIILIMLLCGVRHPITLLLSGLLISFVFAFLFEYFLKIVLPGGIYHLNIPW